MARAHQPPVVPSAAAPTQVRSSRIPPITREGANITVSGAYILKNPIFLMWPPGNTLFPLAISPLGPHPRRSLCTDAIRNFQIRRPSGQAAILISLNLMFLFAMAGLAVDLGTNYYIKGQFQAAADAAASGAALTAMQNNITCTNLTCGTAYACTGSSLPATIQAGCWYAEQNGATASEVSILANNTAVGSYSPSLWLKATITGSQANTFLFLSNFPTATIAAAATAGLFASTPSNCVFALGSSGTTFSYSGSGNFTTNCGIYSNSSFSDTASGNLSTTNLYTNGNFSYSGSGNITATAIDYNGTWSSHGSGTVRPSTGTRTSTSVSDPFAGVPAPPVANSCTQTSYSVNSSSNSILGPGTYCNGLTLGGSGNISLQSGTYIINGGSLTINGSGNITGSDVMFFITGQYGHTASAVQLTGSGNVSLTPNNSGAYEGILIYQDRSVTYASSNNVTMSGNASTGGYIFLRPR